MSTLRKRKASNGPYKSAFVNMSLKRARTRNRLRKRNIRTAGFLGIEKKFYDTAVTASAITAPSDATGGEHDPSTVNTISAPAQGDGESNRDGRKITLRSVQIKGEIVCAVQANQTAADTSPTVIIALVQDTQTNGAQLNSEDVFTNPAASVTLASEPFINLQYSSRFRILKMKKVRLSLPTMSFDGTNIEQTGFSTPFMMYKSLNIPVTFTNTTAGVANVTDNSLHVIAFCNSTSLTPTLYYNSRVRFVG